MMKGKTITYEVGSALYVNMTNRCSNACDFCIRNNGDGAYGSDSLWLAEEPTKEEVLRKIKARDMSKYTELVFCGYGEPTERLFDLLWVAENFKKDYELPVRINTNGQANLICGQDVAPLFAGKIDVVSISLNAPDAAAYQAVCKSKFGEAAYDAILKFAAEVKSYVPKTVFTVVDAALSKADIEKCQTIADSVGIPLRVRTYIGK